MDSLGDFECELRRVTFHGAFSSQRRHHNDRHSESGGSCPIWSYVLWVALKRRRGRYGYGLAGDEEGLGGHPVSAWRK